MTNTQLKRLYYLNRDIERLTERIQELESVAEGTTQRITGMPHCAGVNDKVGNSAIKLAALRLKLEATKLDVMGEYIVLNDYIESIDDPLMRQIMQYRHINGLTWEQVADCVGGGMTGESCRKAHYRYLQENRKEAD